MSIKAFLVGALLLQSIKPIDDKLDNHTLQRPVDKNLYIQDKPSKVIKIELISAGDDWYYIAHTESENRYVLNVSTGHIGCKKPLPQTVKAVGVVDLIVSLDCTKKESRLVIH